MQAVRQPIVVVMGHVDHGKTSLLDCIRRTSVAKREKGAITQHIGASEVPREVIERTCGSLIQKMKLRITIPGILFIDTPGHEAFTNLRRRGGSIADIAVLVIDISQGFEPQTLEAIDILREYRTPFLVAVNKIDLLSGWIDSKRASFLEALSFQRPDVHSTLDERIYEFVGKLHALGFESERFDRVTDFTKQVALIPVSALTGEGIAELLLFIAGLSQKFLEASLKIEAKGPGKGSILEVKEERGLGTTIDVILYDGRIRKNDLIVFGTAEGASSTKVRALLRPKPLDELRDPREKFSYVDEVYAAAGVKIFAPGLESALAGSPIFVATEANEAELRRQIHREIEEVLISAGGMGVLLKADTLGSIEAITRLLSSQGIPVRAARIGHVTKKDVVEMASVREQEKYYGVILAFNVKSADDAVEEAERTGVPIFSSGIIYELLENYKKWMDAEKEREKAEAFERLVLPCRLKVLPGYCFHASHPAIFGIEVLEGRLKPGYELVKENGAPVGTVKAIQKERESLAEATAGMQVAISMDEPIYGRHVKENDVYYSSVPKEHARLLSERYRHLLSDSELALLERINRILGRVVF
ncbi:MAG: translation initiation factor IF-2 [Candidatus Micrarchaeia archaeon]